MNSLKSKLTSDLKKNRWTMKALANQAGVHPSQLSHWLNGRYTPSYKQARSLAAAATEKTGVAYQPLQFIYNKVNP